MADRVSPFEITKKIETLVGPGNNGNMQRWRNQARDTLKHFRAFKSWREILQSNDPTKNVGLCYTILALCHDDELLMNPIIIDEIRAIAPHLCTYPEICVYRYDGYDQVLDIFLDYVKADLGIGKVDEQAKATEAEENGLNSSEDNFIRKQGAVWLIKFEGKTTYIKDCLGIQYISLLIQQPGKEFTKQKLDSVRAGAHQPLFDGDRTVDEEAIADYKKRLMGIDDEMEKAKRNNDLAEQERLTKVKADLCEQVKLGHSEQKLKSQYESSRVSLASALKTAIAAIAREIPSLADHINKAIPHLSARSVKYNPPPDDSRRIYPQEE